MKEQDLKIEKLLIEIYYGIDDETDELVFDEDSMREEFEVKLNELLNN